MSRHWNPNDDLTRVPGADDAARPAKTAWPEGATAGLLLVASLCLAVGSLLYQAAGPRDVVADSVSPN